MGSEVLPRTAAPFERLSAAMAVRYAVTTRQEGRCLLFLVPDATQTTARHITTGLLIGNYAHERGHGRLPPDEARPLLKGNVLLVTPAVSECKAELEHVSFAGTTPLRSLWDILSLARHTAPSTGTHRVFVANPGWVERRLLTRRFSAVIIDASHPRTLSHLEELIQLAREISPLCIAVAPVISHGIISHLSNAGQLDVWLWDPVTRANAEHVIHGGKAVLAPASPHTLWACAEDPGANAVLSECHQILLNTTRSAGTRQYPGLSLTWSIFNRLRALTMPLARVEQASAKTWAGGLADRVKMLAQINGHGDAVWDTTWPDLRVAVETAFQSFLTRLETAKFWTLAIRLESLLRAKDERYRIVVPSVVEVGLLSNGLQEVVNGYSCATEDGRVEIVTFQEDARRVAEGDTAYTILTGIRPTRHRYLNVFPTRPIEEFLYPFEVDLEEATLLRQRQAVESLQGTTRLSLLEELGLASLCRDVAVTPAKPRVEVKQADGKEVIRVKRSSSATDLNLDVLALIESSAPTGAYSSDRETTGKHENAIKVLFSNGTHQLYGLDEYVDLYFHETDQIQRHKVRHLAPGMRVIWFVDGRYDSLFRRTAEAIEKRWATKDRIALGLWDSAKELLIRKHSNKHELYHELCAKGLTSTYSTFCTWIRDEDETIAPQRFAEFATLARATGAFRTEKLLSDTFRCIQQVRGRNRRVGRNLKALLRALQSQTGYEEALESIRQIDPDLADVYAAVDVLEVLEVRHLKEES